MAFPDIHSYMARIVHTWQISLLIGIVLFLMARHVRDLAIVLMGYVVGAYMVLPYLAQRFPAAVEFLKGLKSPILAEIIVGLLGAVVVYALFKLFIFLAAFLIVGVVSYYVMVYLGTLFNLRNYVPEGIDVTWIYLGVGCVLGIIAGIVANKKESQIMAFMSMVVGAFIISTVLANFLLEFLKMDMKTTVGLYTVLGLFIALFTLGLKLHFRKVKSQ